jgi:hypothetical protein
MKQALPETVVSTYKVATASLDRSKNDAGDRIS